MTSGLILHIPHSSVLIPQEWRDGILLNDDELQQEILRMTDMHTHDLYHVEGAERVVFPVSRLLVDAERFSDDTQESMAKKGMGVVYTATSHLKTLRHPPTETERAALLDTYYHPHHRHLNAAAQSAISLRNVCLVVDCHSFPQKALPYEGNDLPRPQICIGTDSFHTPDELTVCMVQGFQDRGYEVGQDTPFAGALVPGDFYRKNASILSVMIEVRRDLYMDEGTGLKNADFTRIKQDITAVIEQASRVFLASP